MAQLINKSASARALRRVVDKGRFTVAELADVAEVSERHLYNVIDQTHTAELSVPAMERVARYLCSHGETLCSRAFACTEYELVRRDPARADGRVDDEMRDAVQALGRIVEAHTSGDQSGAQDALRQMADVYARLQTEIERIPT